jgi:inosine-uridine nucleoside N-ribohydrolase
VRDYGASHLHDPLAVITLFQSNLVTLHNLHIEIETAGRLTRGATLAQKPNEKLKSNAQVALEVEGERAAEFILQRIENS